jgi:hypothetical protein
MQDFWLPGVFGCDIDGHGGSRLAESRQTPPLSVIGQALETVYVDTVAHDHTNGD